MGVLQDAQARMDMIAAMGPPIVRFVMNRAEYDACMALTSDPSHADFVRLVDAGVYVLREG